MKKFLIALVALICPIALMCVSLHAESTNTASNNNIENTNDFHIMNNTYMTGSFKVYLEKSEINKLTNEYIYAYNLNNLKPYNVSGGYIHNHSSNNKTIITLYKYQPTGWQYGNIIDTNTASNIKYVYNNTANNNAYIITQYVNIGNYCDTITNGNIIMERFNQTFINAISQYDFDIIVFETNSNYGLFLNTNNNIINFSPLDTETYLKVKNSGYDLVNKKYTYGMLSNIDYVSMYVLNTSTLHYNVLTPSYDDDITEWSINDLVNENILKTGSFDIGSYLSNPLNNPYYTGVKYHIRFIDLLSYGEISLQLIKHNDGNFIINYYYDDEYNSLILSESDILNNNNFIDSYILADKLGDIVSDIKIESIDFDTINADGIPNLLLSVDYNRGFQSGYNNGYDKGYNNGYDLGVQQENEEYYQEGYHEGSEKGFNYGYSAGYNVGLQEGANSNFETNAFKTLLSSIIDYPINSISTMFDFDIFGVNVSHIVLFIVSIAIVSFVIKRFI